MSTTPGMLRMARSSASMRRPIVGLGIAAVIASIGPVVLADVEVGHHTRPTQATEIAGPVRLEKELRLPTDYLRLTAEPFLARVELGTFDATQLLAEDAVAGFGPTRFGAARNMGVGEERGAWQRISSVPRAARR